MKREIKYPLNGFAIGTTAGLVVNLLRQYVELSNAGLPFWNNLDKQRLFRNGAIGGGIGLIVSYGYYKWDFYNESKASFNSNEHVRTILKRQGLNNSSILLKAKTTRDDLKIFIEEAYCNKLAGKPVKWGSTARGTAVNSNCDFDLLVPFSRNSFVSLQEMYDDLHYRLKQQYKRVKIRRQKHSIGLTFDIDGEAVHFDIVPGREISNYAMNKEVNLFVKGDAFKKSSRIKTNIEVHKEVTVNRPKEREIVKLIKVYRDQNGLDIKSIFIQHLVMEAFDKRSVSYSTADNLIYAMGYLADKLPYARIVDPGNSNNVISSTIDVYSRNTMADRLKNDLYKLDNNKGYLKEIFPV